MEKQRLLPPLLLLLLSLYCGDSFRASGGGGGARPPFSQQQQEQLTSVAPLAAHQHHISPSRDDALARLVAAASNTVSLSYETWRQNTDGGTGMSMSGRDKEGLWASPSLLQELEEVLNDIKIVEDDCCVQFVAASSTHCIEIPLLKQNDIEIVMLSVPAASSHVPRRHPAGTILLYKRLYGACSLRSVIVTRSSSGAPSVRNIKTEVLGETEVMRRLGGLSRLLESTNTLPSAVLEIALFPPTREDEGLIEFSPYEADIDSVLLLSLSIPTQRQMFESRASYEALRLSEEANKSSVDSQTLQNSNLVVLDGMEQRVGGLHEEIGSIVRRVLASRQLPRETLKALGITHTRGVLLYGKPGTGKTLLARELARQLNATTRVVNGPSLFDKYVGNSEANVRELFAEADQDWERLGDKSPLHVIILDELDSIAKARTGTSGDGSTTRDSVVNQLLAQMDGVNERDNFLVVGLTNRKDLIDPALLRPGRLEVHLEITLPTFAGRLEIMHILLREMRMASLLHVDSYSSLVERIAKETEGMSGAELAGLTRSAASFAVERAFAESVSSSPRDAYSSAGADIRQAVDQTTSKVRVQLVDKDFTRALGELWAARGETRREGGGGARARIASLWTRMRRRR